MTSTASIAIDNPTGSRVIFVVPDTMPFGSPIDSTATTLSTYTSLIDQSISGYCIRLSVITTTYLAFMASGIAYPSEPQADLPSLPEQLPEQSLAGAAINATSIGVMPFSISRGLPPCVRNSTGASMPPSDMNFPSAADI